MFLVVSKIYTVGWADMPAWPAGPPRRPEPEARGGPLLEDEVRPHRVPKMPMTNENHTADNSMTRFHDTGADADRVRNNVREGAGGQSFGPLLWQQSYKISRPTLQF